MRFRRPVISSTALSVLVAVYILFLTNATYWSRISARFADEPLNLVLLNAAVLLVYVVFLTIFSAPYVIRPMFIILVMIAAAVSYYTDRFGTIMDRDMIQNIVQTTLPESSNLITGQMVLHMLLFGVLPSLLIAWVGIRHRPFWQKVKVNTALCLGLVAIAALLIGSNLRAFIPFWQHDRHETMAYLNPAMALVGAVDYAQRQLRDLNIKAQPYGRDARLGPRVAQGSGKRLLVVVVGETARAQNFSLTGYGRDTNPMMAARDVIAFTNVTSCATATAISMPCMFSHLGRDNYSRRAFLGSENLADVLRHAGLKVEWWDNNTGPKNVADRIPVEMVANTSDPALCAGGECLDQVLIDRLRGRLVTYDGNGVLILHVMGSHGPAYFRRYPPEFERFKPVCRTSELNECSSQELLNAYDNTILYTDYILASVIDLLKQRDDLETAMYYMSDHGESLGENGLYLHGAPYMFAPEEQKRIPFIAWFSDSFARRDGLDAACLRARAGEELSHDNMFDTVLGLMDVQTDIYNPALDAFAACRSPATSSVMP